jgi:RNA polymerase sigma-70 factor, ECF subfamily
MRMPGHPKNVQNAAVLDGLESLYRRRFGAFLRVAASIVGNDVRGADAVQEAFAKAIRSRTQYRGEATLEAWVWPIVVNTARQARRERTTEVAIESEVGDSEMLAYETPGPFSLKAHLDALPERERVVVFLRYFADLDYATIAEVLGVRIGTVSATLHAAHHALRRALDEEEILR